MILAGYNEKGNKDHKYYINDIVYILLNNKIEPCKVLSYEVKGTSVQYWLKIVYVTDTSKEKIGAVQNRYENQVFESREALIESL